MLRGITLQQIKKLCAPLTELRKDITNFAMREYEPNGDTPGKTRYQFPTEFPRTVPHDILIAGTQYDPVPSKSVGSIVVFSEVLKGHEPAGGKF